MAAAVALTPHVVHTSLNYFLEPSKGGIDVVYLGSEADKLRKHDPHEVEITDMRGSEGDFALDKQGFQVVQSDTVEKTFDEDERIKAVYYPEAAELMKKVTGATHVRAVSHVVRNQSWEEANQDGPTGNHIAKKRGSHPARYIHIDQSYHGALLRLREHLSDTEVERLTKTRWAIVNVWRPFGRPAERDALAVCDARSVSDSDLRAFTGIPPKMQHDRDVPYLSYEGAIPLELWNVVAPDERASSHRWYYCSKLRPDEALLIKQFDSKKEGVARRTPHTSFVSKEDQGPPRQSVETRCLVFWEDQDSD